MLLDFERDHVIYLELRFVSTFEMSTLDVAHFDSRLCLLWLPTQTPKEIPTIGLSKQEYLEIVIAAVKHAESYGRIKVNES